MAEAFNGPPPGNGPYSASAERVAELAIELLKAAHATGDATVIAAAEVAAFAAGVYLAKSIRSQA